MIYALQSMGMSKSLALRTAVGLNPEKHQEWLRDGGGARPL
jgi:hypothetical protein